MLPTANESGVMIDAHVDKTAMVYEVVDPIWKRLAIS
jgi:hypothetical protein